MKTKDGKTGNKSSERGKRIGYAALVMTAILLSAVFAVAIPATIAQVPPGPPNPPVNVTESSSLRVYGEGNMGPYKGYDSQGQMIYDNWSDPFNPAILQKDSITFNPAIILWDGSESPMSADSKNIHEKEFLRMWYEPEHVYTKPGYCYPTIEVESTYMLIDKQDWIPTHGAANVTYFKFPIVEIPGQTGVGAFENNLSEGYIEADRPNVVKLSYVNGTVGNYNKTTNGTIRIEKTYMLSPGAEIQFLDFKLQYKYIVVRDGKHYAKVKMSYAGNYEDDTEITTILGEYDDGTTMDPHKATWFKRHMERYGSSDHANHVTWYARFENELVGGGVEITVGKEIAAGDTFYVNGVRYDVPAVEVLDTDKDNVADAFKYITLRTPLPKGDGSEVLDDGKISSQWIVTVPPSTALPLTPPFNQPYTMVDDINVVLWEPLKHTDQWPSGNPNGNIGTEFFPLAERYLTMQNPPDAWLIYFHAIPVDTDNDMNPPMPNDPQVWNGPYTPARGNFDLAHWIAYDVDERLVAVNKPLRVAYLDEKEEQRYSTDLLEILNETLYHDKAPDENWTKFDIQTLPDQYTEFVLPELPDVETPYITKPGDYLLTSSFLANNSIARSDIVDPIIGIPRVAFAYDPDYEDGLGDGLDIYVNQWGNTSSIRIYGEDNLGPITGYGPGGIAKPYDHWRDPFDPTVLRKDAITFNPAIIGWDGNVYPMSADSDDIDEKVFLRMWYEPEHEYSKPAYKRPTIETETTYMLIDRQDKLPTSGKANSTWFIFPIAEDETTDRPGLELIENPNSEPDRPNVVTLAYVNGTVVGSYNKTTNGTIRIEKTYKLDIGDKVQFLDHKLTFVSMVTHNGSYYAKVKVDYAGNRNDDTGTTVVLATFDGGATYDPDPHRITWFKRHSETFRNPSHPQVTWYARLDSYDPDYGWAEITVGKELRVGDVFYVDGVRYDIPAIEVIDTDGAGNADSFKYITIRTPYPKCIATGVSPVPDDGIISSQWIECIPPYVPLPVLPPFNEEHYIVDDINVELWKPLKHVDEWPVGNEASGKPGMEWFPLAERYLTMQYPPAAWQKYFRAVPVDTDNDMNPKMPNDPQLWNGPYYPGNDIPSSWPVGVCTKEMKRPSNWTVFDVDHWIALDVNERIIPEPYDPLEVFYVAETLEPRYSTNLLEILNETITGVKPIVENWTKYDIQTLPDQYTEFVLPSDEVHAGQPLMNDYLITSSFLANNSLNKSDMVRNPPGIPRVAFVFDASDSLAKTGFYVNELVKEPPEPENKAPVLVIDVYPTSVNALETVTVDTAGTYDDQYPLRLECDWGDGTVDIDYMWRDNTSAPVFKHSYTKNGTYTITVTATDKYGEEDVKTASITVNNDGAVLHFGYGWNAISAPVQNSTSMSDLFVMHVPGFFAVYSWNNSAQKWQTEDLSQPLDPAKGYFIWATDDADIELTGTAVTFNSSWISGLGWNLVGAGAEPVVLTDKYAYWYDHSAGTYIPTHNIEPGKAYFIWV